MCDQAGPSSSRPDVRIYLQNVMTSTNLGCKLDLVKIARHAFDHPALARFSSEYNPKVCCTTEGRQARVHSWALGHCCHTVQTECRACPRPCCCSSTHTRLSRSCALALGTELPCRGAQVLQAELHSPHLCVRQDGEGQSLAHGIMADCIILHLWSFKPPTVPLMLHHGGDVADSLSEAARVPYCHLSAVMP